MARVSLPGSTFTRGPLRVARSFGLAITYNIETRFNFPSELKASRETRPPPIVGIFPRDSREHENHGRGLAAHCGEGDSRGLSDGRSSIDRSNRSQRLPIHRA